MTQFISYTQYNPAMCNDQIGFKLSHIKKKVRIEQTLKEQFSLSTEMDF